MVGRRIDRALALILSLLAWGIGPAAVQARAEVRTTVSIDAYNSVTITDDASTASGFAQSEIDFESVGGGDVRSRLQLRARLWDVDGTSMTDLTIPRAEIRWRMPIGESYRVRFTAGRSRLSWGDGVLFNAADTINGARPGSVDLTADVLRDETQWLIAGYFPLGRFAFLEPVVLVPGYRSASDGSASDEPANSTALLENQPAWQTGAGGRLQFKTGQVKTELGYLYRGDEEIHQPSLSLQGNIGVDWYLGLSLRLPEHPSEDFFASGGILYQGNSRRVGGWSARLETLWEQQGERLGIYPELTWSPSQLFSLFLRHQGDIIDDAEIVDLHDVVGTSSIGFGWTPTTGLTLSLFSTLTSNAPGSAVDKSGTITALVSYVF